MARAALDAIGNTFVPGGDGLPSATEAGVPDALLALGIYLSQAKWVAYEPGTRGDLDSFMRDADACGWGCRAGPGRFLSHDGQRAHGRFADRFGL
jgi:hypothetical protein